MQLKNIINLVLIAFVFFSCEKPPTLKVIYTVDEPIGEIVKAFEAQMEESLGYDIELIIGDGSHSNIDSLEAGAADITIVENSISYQSKRGINAIVPFYPQVLHIFYQGEVKANTVEELFYGKKVFIGQPGSATYEFLMELFHILDIDTSKFEITQNIFENEVFCGFTDIVNEEYLAGLSGYRLFSFDNIEQFGRGSLAEAISLKFPQMKPFIIPQRTYGGLTEEAVVTIATDAVLVTRGDLPEDVIYNITKTIFQHKERFTSISPLIYLDLKEDFERTRLNFPLHNGARIYLDRDEPSIFERYAELIGVVFSILVTLISSGLYLSKWQAQRKKDRVDIFYQDIMDIKNELSSLKKTSEVAQRIKMLKDSQHKAFKMLIDEELRADESFRIYMELSKETIQELTARYKRLKRAAH